VRFLICAMYDLSRNDGYTGHLQYLLSILREEGHTYLLTGMRSKSSHKRRTDVLVEGTDVLAQLMCASLAVEKARHWNPDIFLFTQAGSIFNGVLSSLVRSMNLPMIYDCLDPVPETFLLTFNRSINYVFQPWLKLSERFIDAGATATLSVSPGLDAILRKRGWRGPIFRFYNVHNTFPVGQPGKSKLRERAGWESSAILVYAGGLQEKVRGLEDQLRAVAIAVQLGANVKFLIVGSSGSPTPFQVQSSKLGIDDSVLFLGPVTPSELADILSDCDVAVSNSLPYALPSKIFEYLSNGVHIISVDDLNDVNVLFKDFVELYDGSIEDLAMLLKRKSKSTRKTAELTRIRALIASLRNESKQSLLRSIDLCAVKLKLPETDRNGMETVETVGQNERRLLESKE